MAPSATRARAGRSSSTPSFSSMSPNFLNLPMKMFTRERVVPTISVTISRDTRGSAHRHGRRASRWGPNELFGSFEQRGADRTSLGLGLAFSRWPVDANQGRIYARNLVGEGCVFTVDLLRIVVPSAPIG